MMSEKQNLYSSIDFLGMEIVTFQYTKELEEMHCIAKKMFNPNLVSDIYESPISFSFRIYNEVSKITHSFYQVIKDDDLLCPNS